MNDVIRAVLRKYDNLLSEHPVVHVEDKAGKGSLGHLRWMVVKMLGEGDGWSVRKVNRWLGFIQGSLWQAGVIGILELRDDSRHLYDDEGPRVG